MKNYTKAQLVKRLLAGTVKVTFIKHNGDNREMRCTLRDAYIPEDQKPKVKSDNSNDDYLPVYDLDKQDWRSFNPSSVLEVVSAV